MLSNKNRALPPDLSFDHWYELYQYGPGVAWPAMEMVNDLSDDRCLWLLIEYPDTLQLIEDAPGWLINECLSLRVVKAAGVDKWKLTSAGYTERQRLLT